jgi:HNH endonuclease
MGYKHLFKKPAEHRFFNKILFNDCWEWTGSLNGEKGYGMFYDGSKRIYAHRFSYLIHYGEIPEKLIILHSCDNSKCVNPDHLSVGTHKENSHQASSRGRLKKVLTKRGYVSHLKGKIKLNCKKGHDISTPESVYVNHNRPSAGRICRICNRLNKNMWASRRRESEKKHEKIICKENC